mgnify:CR=1 FL=1
MRSALDCKTASLLASRIARSYVIASTGVAMGGEQH